MAEEKQAAATPPHAPVGRGEASAEADVAAWIALARANRRAMRLIEGRLKQAGLPQLAWYDVLWELERAGADGLRPFALERRLLFEQYNLSRLADRMAKAGLVERRACAEDGRGHMLAITEQGREMRERMWAVYRPAIAAVIGSSLSLAEKAVLAGLLDRTG
ncbi:MarR family transcriptional regulator [Nitratireductor mangrovi]|uniref:MarR family transcriptional regulator n=1 Tax=Nitratireductor mangrovi TaxID=2599600 RepID=A0A5B8L202_9HYPH|nr:MarR family transcriptional regulator [Nitratireductor mangrovi]QDZ01966.1 MarR family transcriptional regulator [Nitratireductor mangrovi]